MVRPKPTLEERLEREARRGTKSMCWCQRKMVKVSVEMVWAGETVSCGQPECAPVIATPSPNSG